jgi:hypothetical protein
MQLFLLDETSGTYIKRLLMILAGNERVILFIWISYFISLYSLMKSIIRIARPVLV